MQNLNINGTGYVHSGEYNKVVICGSCMGSGDLIANKLEINGTLFFEGNVECDSIIINGAFEAQDINTANIIINGQLNCNNIIANIIEIDARNDCSINLAKSKKIKTIIKKSIFTKYKKKVVININTLISDDIEVSGLKSQEVNCNILNAKDNTHINKLYYSSQYIIDDSVKIDYIMKK